jgi:SAM-dependent methyltransferase
MWKRFAAILRCPLCRSHLELVPFEEVDLEVSQEQAALAERIGSSASALKGWVESGQLICRPCRARFPITGGLPVMLPYTTPLHEAFVRKWSARLSSDLEFPGREPAPGEDFVRASFSTEWLEYDYDGVIWELNYRDHELRFRKEVGPAIEASRWFLEVGCGLGLATSVAQSCSGGDCVGLDLSLAVTKAVRQFRDNPFLHFVQASAFHPPFAAEQFDVIYSRGVLHHTFSTRKAFESVAPLCRAGGVFFLWLYGPRSINSTPLRLALYALEMVARPLVSRAPDSWPATLFLRTMALAYMAFNHSRRLRNPEIERLTFRRAVHAARDRFTPRFAHRHSAAEISSWFRSNGFARISVLDWREMPAADQEDFRRNVGVRAERFA